MSVLFLCQSFQLITLVNVLLSSYGRQTVLDESCKKKKFKVAAFSPLVLKPNIFEKIKYAQEKEIFGSFNIESAC